MTLRAADVKDEHGWPVLNDQGEIAFHESSREKARIAAKNGGYGASERTKEEVEVEVLPADNSPEAMAAKAAWDIDQKIKRAVSLMKAGWLECAANLYIFHENQMWEALNYESWRSYLADPDVGIDERQAYEWTAIYKQLVIDRGVDPARLGELHYTKVAKMLPAIRRNQVSVDEALSDAKVLFRSDIEAKYSGRFQPQKAHRGEPDTSTKIHTDSEPGWALCPTCGSRKQVDPQTGEWL